MEASVRNQSILESVLKNLLILGEGTLKGGAIENTIHVYLQIAPSGRINAIKPGVATGLVPG